MAAKEPANPIPIMPNDKELRALVFEATGHFECAVEWFYEVSYLLEAIKAMTEKWSTVRGLAEIGDRLVDQHAAHFEEAHARYKMEVERNAS